MLLLLPTLGKFSYASFLYTSSVSKTLEKLRLLGGSGLVICSRGSTPLIMSMME